MKKGNLIKRIIGLAIVMALMLSGIPFAAMADAEAASAVADPGTAHRWESMMGTEIDGNRYAGRVWVDKSVYKEGDTALLNTKGGAGSSFEVALEEDEAFQIIFSALGSTMTTESTISSVGPLDVVLILDDSTSMDDIISGNTTRLQKLIEASNELLANLEELDDIRIGIVAYNQNAIQILPFGIYENGIELRVRNNKYAFDENNRQDKGGTIQAFDQSGRLLYNNTNGYARGTNTQAGINMGLGMLEKAQNTKGRTPIALVLTDGAANTAAQNTFYNIENQTPQSIFSGGVPSSVAMATLLTAAYKKAKVEDVYGKLPMIYGVGVDIAGDAAANAVINPGAAQNGFNASNSSETITDAYELYTEWLSGRTVRQTEYYFGNYNFTFDHGYSGVTRNDIRDNIHYVDTYYPVASADLNDVFHQIYEEISSGVFNPISDSTIVAGGTGVDDTPLIYVDFIGKHMEIKEIQSVTLFGSSYGVLKNADGSYTVAEASGINPTTNERWNTARDIRIEIIEQADGTQKLEINIHQEILPIILEKVVSETVGKVTESTITEYLQNPLRIYYTVGIDSDILLPNGKVDLSKIQGYEYIDDANGTVSFYSNQFGKENAADASGTVYKGDAHVGFRPAPENRYYYYQKNQGIFTKITDKNGKTVEIPENNEYGIVWNSDLYNLNWMTYEEYKNAEDEDVVYNYVTYYRPTPLAGDAANAAEEITYLVYSEWKYLKDSVAFYDDTAKGYLYDGKAIPEDERESVINAYLQSHPNAALYAVLGVGSRRTSRLHNMMVDKIANPTATAVEHYTPEYLENKKAHHDNDVAVWLGNNGKLTLEIDTGIALTKAVTEAIGDADDLYTLTVGIPAGVAAAPIVLDDEGRAVASSYQGNVLSVALKAGQTVYISGIPAGTECTIGEEINGDYYIASQTEKVKVPLLSEALNGAAQFAPAVVTNSPKKYGDLFITKALTSEHNIPDSILDTPFEITANLGAGLAGREFSIKDSAHAAPYEKTADGQGNLTFQIKARQTVEILGIPAGTNVTITETPPDTHFEVSYRTRDYSGAEADGDQQVEIPSGARSTAVVFNAYTPSSATVDLDIRLKKDFADASVAEQLLGGEFEFLVEKYGATAPIASGSVRYNAKEYGEKSLTIEDVLKNEVYTEAGTYSYKISEVKGNVANVSYDRTIYTFDVVVADRGGRLEAEVVDMNDAKIQNTIGDSALDYAVAFRNTYETAPISMDITKAVVNQSEDPEVNAHGFRFKSIAVDQEGNPLDPNAPETASNVILSDAAGEARISGVYTREQIGTHYYIVYEIDDGKAGWIYSKAQYFVTVEVAEDSAGKLSASMSIEPYNEAARKEKAPSVAENNRGQLYFTNTYAPEAATLDLDGKVKKELSGKALEADQFTFYVYKDGDRTAPILSGTNDLNGDVNFVDFDQALRFEAAGKYQYDIVEKIPANAVYDSASGKYILDGMHYDATIYDLVVEVSNDAASGKLEANYYFEDSVDRSIVFLNQYQAVATEYAPGGRKVLNGRAPHNGEFEFELYEGDQWIETVTNKADGSFEFDAISYDREGIYTYTIKEKAGNVAGVRYDGVAKPITLTVTVTDVGGVLRAKANLANGEIRFENSYTPAPASVTFNGTKQLLGAPLQDDDFTFKLYQTDHSFDIDGNGAKLLGTAQNKDGAFSFAQSFDATGSYHFVIIEDSEDAPEGIVYDRTHYQYIVQIGDIGDGKLRAEVTDMNSATTSAAAPMVEASAAFTNATVDEATEKEVYLAGNSTAEIDGKKVDAGDVLTYFITYTNYTGGNVVADIMDTIPAHTEYVEGSASHDGSYAGTHLNWILNVAKGESVTVSFEVRVTEPQAVVSNTAVVRDGVNVYTTNEVVNHTVEDPAEKDVASAEEPTISIDGKSVAAGDALVYTLRYTNASSEAVDLVITDQIPEYTSYVEGSADQGGVYENGALRWELKEVAPWAVVTVSFEVIVDDSAEGIITNAAKMQAGGNDYVTNETENPVTPPEEEEEPKDPEKEDPKPNDPPAEDPKDPEEKPDQPEQKPQGKPEQEKIENSSDHKKPQGNYGPETGDRSNMSLWLALLAASGGLLWLLLFGMKKKENEEA